MKIETIMIQNKDNHIYLLNTILFTSKRSLFLFIKKLYIYIYIKLLNKLIKFAYKKSLQIIAIL
jgi:hypothetical protein